MGTGTDAAVTLKYILAQVKHSLQCDDKYDEWILQEIINVVTDMNMFQVKLFGNKTIKCTITDINTIDFPIDYIDYVELYYKTLDGIKVPLSYEGRIAFPVSQVCGLQGNENTIADCEFPDAHNFGVGGGYNYCYYRPDKNRHKKTEWIKLRNKYKIWEQVQTQQLR